MNTLLRTSFLSRASAQISQPGSVFSRLGSVRALHLKKDGTPDKRYLENVHIIIKKDGTPDLRFKPVEKQDHPPALGRPLRRNGSPDLRFNPTFKIYSAKKHDGLTKRGMPDLRLKENKSITAEEGAKPVAKKTARAKA